LQALTSCPALRCALTNDSTESAGITLSAELYMYNCGQPGCFVDNMLKTSESLLQLNKIITVRTISIHMRNFYTMIYLFFIIIIKQTILSPNIYHIIYVFLVGFYVLKLSIIGHIMIQVITTPKRSVLHNSIANAVEYSAIPENHITCIHYQISLKSNIYITLWMWRCEIKLV
jgi:hypothetical protein